MRDRSRAQRLASGCSSASVLALVGLALLSEASGAATGATAAPAAAAVPTTGAEAYAKGCASCHDTGTGGAPKVGDHAAWGLRIAQGKLTLYRHSIAGRGGMPARGGTAWPDATIRLAVDYMVERNK